VDSTKSFCYFQLLSYWNILLCILFNAQRRDEFSIDHQGIENYKVFYRFVHIYFSYSPIEFWNAAWSPWILGDHDFPKLRAFSI
jgi:hypothetical protein